MTYEATSREKADSLLCVGQSLRDEHLLPEANRAHLGVQGLWSPPAATRVAQALGDTSTASPQTQPWANSVSDSLCRHFMSSFTQSAAALCEVQCVTFSPPFCTPFSATPGFTKRQKL